jgi:hypothetical protein
MPPLAPNKVQHTPQLQVSKFDINSDRWPRVASGRAALLQYLQQGLSAAELAERYSIVPALGALLNDPQLTLDVRHLAAQLPTLCELCTAASCCMHAVRCRNVLREPPPPPPLLPPPSPLHR